MRSDSPTVTEAGADMAWLDGYFFNSQDPRAQQAYAALGQGGLSLMAAAQNNPAGVQRGLAGAMAAPYAIQEQQQQAAMRDQSMQARQLQMEQIGKQEESQRRLAALLASGKKIDDPEVTSQIMADPELYSAFVRSKLSARETAYAHKTGINPATGLPEYWQGDNANNITWTGIRPVPAIPGTTYDTGGTLTPQPGALSAKRDFTAASQPSVVPFGGTDTEGREIKTFVPNPAAGGRVSLSDLAPIGAMPSAGGGPTLKGPTPGERATQTAEATNVPEAVRTKYMTQRGALDALSKGLDDYNNLYFAGTTAPTKDEPGQGSPGWWSKAGQTVGVKAPRLRELLGQHRLLINLMGKAGETGAMQEAEIRQFSDILPKADSLLEGPENFAAAMESAKRFLQYKIQTNEDSIKTAAPISIPSSSRLNDLDKKYKLK